METLAKLWLLPENWGWFQRRNLAAEKLPGLSRKRLFAVACCWEMPRSVSPKVCLEAVRAVENYVDFSATAQELSVAHDRAMAYFDEPRSNPALVPGTRANAQYDQNTANSNEHWQYWTCRLSDLAPELDQTVADISLQVVGPASARHKKVRQSLLFASFALSWGQPDWRTSDVVGLACAMYKSKNFGDAPILADALQDAGCDDDSVLLALRAPGFPWYRGNTVFDYLAFSHTRI